MPVSSSKARAMALALPATEERLSYRLPTYRVVGGKMFAVMREELQSIVLKLGFDERDAMIESAPEVFYSNKHYRSYPMVLVHLSKVPTAELRKLLAQAWRLAAPRRVLKEHGDEV